MTAPASPVKFTENGAGYAVTRRADGAALGTVTKGSTYYNLHPRPATYIHWTATDAHGQTVKDSDGRSRKFSTRTDAAAYLTEHAAPVGETVAREVVEHITADDAVVIVTQPSATTSTVRSLGGTADLGRVYPSRDETGFVALPTTHECETCPSVGSTLCDEDGVSIVYPTRGEAARAIFAHLQEEDDDEPVDVVDDLCDECGEPRDLNDDGTLAECAVCLEALHRQQEAETARIEELCSVAERAHTVAMSTRGRGKGAAFTARADALDALRVAALPEEATNVDALDLALGGTTVEAIENRYLALRGERLADELSEGAVVRFRPGVMPSCEGVNFLVEGELLYDNSRGGRPYVWLRDDAEGTRSAYVDALVLVTPAEATL